MKKREVVLEVFKAIEDEGKLACYWKSPRGLSDALDVLKKDVDLLCKKEPVEIFKRLGFKRFASNPRHDHRGVSNWVKPVEGGFCHLHVHERIYTGKHYPLTHRIPWVEYVLHHTKVDEETGIPIPIPEVDFLLLLARYAFEKKITADSLRLSLERTNIEEIRKHASLVLGKKSGKKLAKTLRKGIPKRKAVHAIMKPGLKAIRSSTLTSGKNLLRNAQGIGRVAYSRLKPEELPNLRPLSNGLRREKHGIIIAIVGPDGSGKSTLSSALSQWLADFFDVHNVYFGRGDFISTTWHGLAKMKWAMLGGIPDEKIKEGEKLAQMSFVERSEKEKGLRKVVRNFSHIALADRKARDSAWTAERISKGAIIITDRFPIMNVEFLDGAMVEKDGTISQRVFAIAEAQMLKRIGVVPDVVFRLNISAEVAWKRKPDHNIEDISDKIESLKRAVFPGSYVIETDATLSEKAILDFAKEAIWDLL